MSDRDFYEVLGVSRDADLSAIKKAYRQAAIRFHPDKNPGDAAAEERFKEAAEAYAVLSDRQKRATYDQFGRAGLGGRGGFGDFNQDAFAGFEDILGDLFGLGSIFGGGRRQRGRAGRDLRYDLEIEFEEAVRGLETKIQVPRLDVCETCRGSGAEPDGSESCSQCAGRGQVAFQQGFFTIARTCSRCGGSGRIVTRACETCEGNGRVRTESTLSLRIPPGVDDGTRLRMTGQGEAGSAGGPPGDLYVVLSVRQHPHLGRDGQDLLYDAPISFAQAALGAELRIPTLDGEHTLTLPAGTQPGASFRLRGRGVPVIGGSGTGDQIVIVRLVVPKRLSDEQKELIQSLAEHDGDEIDEPGLFDRVKNIFS